MKMDREEGDRSIRIYPGTERMLRDRDIRGYVLCKQVGRTFACLKFIRPSSATKEEMMSNECSFTLYGSIADVSSDISDEEAILLAGMNGFDIGIILESDLENDTEKALDAKTGKLIYMVGNGPDKATADYRNPKTG